MEEINNQKPQDQEKKSVDQNVQQPKSEPKKRTPSTNELILGKFNEYFKTKDALENETLTSSMLIKLLGQKHFTGDKEIQYTADERLRFDKFYNGCSDILKSDTKDHLLRHQAGLSLLKLSNFFQDDTHIPEDNIKLLKQLQENGAIKESILECLKDTTFIDYSKENILAALNYKGDSDFQNKLKEEMADIIDNIKDPSLYKRLYIDNYMIKKEIEKNILALKDLDQSSVEYKVLKEALIKKEEELLISKEILERYKRQFSEDEINEVENNKILKRDLNKLFNSKKGDLYETPELLSLISARSKRLQDSNENLEYEYILRHQKRMKYFEDNNLLYKVPFYAFYKKDKLIGIDKKELYSKTGNGYSIPQSKHKDLIVQEVVNKLLLKDLNSKVYINFGSLVSEEDKERTATVALKEMHDFLLLSKNFNAEKLYKHLEENFKVQGMNEEQIKQLINTTFPDREKSAFISSQSNNGVEKTVVSLLNEKEIEIDKIADPVIKLKKQKELLAEVNEVFANSNASNDLKNKVSKMLKVNNSVDFYDVVATLKEKPYSDIKYMEDLKEKQEQAKKQKQSQGQKPTPKMGYH